MYEIGQRITYKGDMANHPGNGAIVARRAGRNEPGVRVFTVNFGRGVQELDTSVMYDVVLEDGREFFGLYPDEIGGSFGDKTKRFMLADGSVASSAIASLLAGVAIRKASLKAKADEAAAEMKRAMGAALEAGLKMGLIPEDQFRSSGKRGTAAAHNLRQELKALGIKARVKADGYSSIDVTVKAGDALNARTICDKYEAGSFDGMTDCYNYDPSAWGRVFGDVRYVFVRKEG